MHPILWILATLTLLVAHACYDNDIYLHTIVALILQDIRF